MKVKNKSDHIRDLVFSSIKASTLALPLGSEMKSGRSSLIWSSVSLKYPSKLPQNYDSAGSAVVLSNGILIPIAFITLSAASKPSDPAKSGLEPYLAKQY